MAVLWNLVAGQDVDPFGQFMRGAQMRQANDDKVARRSFLQSLLDEGSTDYNRASIGLLQHGDTEGARVAAQLGKIKADEQGGYYGTPIFAEKDGQPILGTFNKRGDWKEINTGGAVPSPGVKTLDTGTGYAIINSRSGAPMQGGVRPMPQQSPMTQGADSPYQQGGMQPQPAQPSMQQMPPQQMMQPQMNTGYIRKDVAGKERQEAIGQQEGKDLANLPKAIDAGKYSLSVLDKAINHPGRETATGMSGYIDPRNYLPGTKSTDFQSVLEQIKGRAFLQAFESLKGGGQITEVEGAKATSAIARLNRAQSDNEFRAALTELRGVIEGGLRRSEELQNKINLGAIDVRPYGENPTQQQQRRSGLDALDVPTRNRAIGELRYRMKSDPRAVEQFDEHFGVGSAARALGGLR